MYTERPQPSRSCPCDCWCRIAPCRHPAGQRPCRCMRSIFNPAGCLEYCHYERATRLALGPRVYTERPQPSRSCPCDCWCRIAPCRHPAGQRPCRCMRSIFNPAKCRGHCHNERATRLALGPRVYSERLQPPTRCSCKWWRRIGATLAKPNKISSQTLLNLAVGFEHLQTGLGLGTEPMFWFNTPGFSPATMIIAQNCCTNAPC